MHVALQRLLVHVALQRLLVHVALQRLLVRVAPQRLLVHVALQRLLVHGALQRLLVHVALQRLSSISERLGCARRRRSASARRGIEKCCLIPLQPASVCSDGALSFGFGGSVASAGGGLGYDFGGIGASACGGLGYGSSGASAGGDFSLGPSCPSIGTPPVAAAVDLPWQVHPAQPTASPLEIGARAPLDSAGGCIYGPLGGLVGVGNGPSLGIGIGDVYLPATGRVYRLCRGFPGCGCNIGAATAIKVHVPPTWPTAYTWVAGPPALLQAGAAAESSLIAAAMPPAALVADDQQQVDELPAPPRRSLRIRDAADI